MNIHVVSTINGQENEGMRNIATHLSREFEKENTVYYSSFKEIYKIIKYSLKSDVTFIFARANSRMYYICRMIEKFCKNIYFVLVQKPQPGFISKNNNRPLRCNYFTISQEDTKDLKTAKGHNVHKLNIGIDKKKFSSVSSEEAIILKEKYGFDKMKPLVVHVGHCSAGRGLEDFCCLDSDKYERMVVASGMFNSEEVASKLDEAGVKLHVGFISNINEIYQMADVYLFPTQSTEFVISIPLSVLESLSCGTPVVAYESFENIKFIEINNSKAIKTIKNSSELQMAVEEIRNYKNDNSYLSNQLSWSSIVELILQIIKEQNI